MCGSQCDSIFFSGCHYLLHANILYRLKEWQYTLPLADVLCWMPVFSTGCQYSLRAANILSGQTAYSLLAAKCQYYTAGCLVPITSITFQCSVQAAIIFARLPIARRDWLFSDTCECPLQAANILYKLLADLLTDHIDSKQYRDSVNLLLTCHPSPSLITFAFRSSEVRRLLLDLDLYDGIYPLGVFPLFSRELPMFRPPSQCSVSMLAGDRPMLLQIR